MYKKFIAILIILINITACSKKEESKVVKNSNDDLKLEEKSNTKLKEKNDLKTIDDLKLSDNKSEDKNLEDKKIEEKPIVSDKKSEENDSSILNELKGKQLVYKHVHGRWFHSINFKEDGYFESESNSYQVNTEGGRHYRTLCKITGQFVVEKQLDESCYTLRLVNPEIISNTGEETIDENDYALTYTDNIAGFEKNKNGGDPIFQDLYTLYLPGRSLDRMTEELNSRLILMGLNLSGQSPYYMIINNSTTDPFVEYEEGRF